MLWLPKLRTPTLVVPRHVQLREDCYLSNTNLEWFQKSDIESWVIDFNSRHISIRTSSPLLHRVSFHVFSQIHSNLFYNIELKSYFIRGKCFWSSGSLRKNTSFKWLMPRIFDMVMGVILIDWIKSMFSSTSHLDQLSSTDMLCSNCLGHRPLA